MASEVITVTICYIKLHKLLCENEPYSVMLKVKEECREKFVGEQILEIQYLPTQIKIEIQNSSVILLKLILDTCRY